MNALRRWLGNAGSLLDIVRARPKVTMHMKIHRKNGSVEYHTGEAELSWWDACRLKWRKITRGDD